MRRGEVEPRRARLVSGTRFRTSRAEKRKTNLHFDAVEGKDDLLQLDCSSTRSLDPSTFANTNPLSELQVEENMGRSDDRRGIYTVSSVSKPAIGILDCFQFLDDDATKNPC